MNFMVCELNHNKAYLSIMTVLGIEFRVLYMQGENKAIFRTKNKNSAQGVA
jgi:hypothetical protein